MQLSSHNTDLWLRRKSSLTEWACTLEKMWLLIILSSWTALLKRLKWMQRLCSSLLLRTTQSTFWQRTSPRSRSWQLDLIRVWTCCNWLAFTRAMTLSICWVKYSRMTLKAKSNLYLTEKIGVGIQQFTLQQLMATFGFWRSSLKTSRQTPEPKLPMDSMLCTVELKKRKALSLCSYLCVITSSLQTKLTQWEALHSTLQSSTRNSSVLNACLDWELTPIYKTEMDKLPCTLQSRAT